MNSCDDRSPSALQIGGIGAGRVHRRPQPDQQLARLGGDGRGGRDGLRRWQSWPRTLAARDGRFATGRDDTGRVSDAADRNLRPWIAAAADVAVLVLFVVIGRRSHHEDAGLVGFLRVWWPFVVPGSSSPGSSRVLPGRRSRGRAPSPRGW